MVECATTAAGAAWAIFLKKIYLIFKVYFYDTDFEYSQFIYLKSIFF